MVRSLMLVVALALVGCDRSEKIDYIVEESGRPVGTLEARLSLLDDHSSEQEISLNARVTMRALGQKVLVTRRDELVVDTDTRQLITARRNTRWGELDVVCSLQATADSVHLTGVMENALTVPRTADMFLEDGFRFGFMLEGLKAAEPDSVFRYRGVDMERAMVVHVEVRPVGLDSLVLGGETRPAWCFDIAYPDNHSSRRIWIDPADGLLLRNDNSDGTSLRLGGLESGERFSPVELDSLILTPTNVAIEDPLAIRYMKVRVEINSTGEPLTPDGLNVPGQQFTGTVEGTTIEGVFEIAHVAFDGSGAPGFPPSSSAYADSALAPFLQSGFFIDSDDAEVKTMAVRVTAGSETCWDAARRLARWVEEEIDYAIPGGGSASGTLEMRKGECGSHSRLMAGMCRAVGIPARMVIGGMYFNNPGPTFGQHAWTEVHMGPAGWIPLDATIGEDEVLDSGHVRLGYMSSFQPVFMEILDHRVAVD